MAVGEDVGCRGTSQWRRRLVALKLHYSCEANVVHVISRSVVTVLLVELGPWKRGCTSSLPRFTRHESISL